MARNNKTNMDRYTLEGKVRKSLQSCILLVAVEKNKWLQRLEYLSIFELGKLIIALEERNQIIAKYVHEALAEDRDNTSFKQLQIILNQGIRDVYHAEENSEQKHTVSLLNIVEEQLQNL